MLHYSAADWLRVQAASEPTRHHTNRLVIVGKTSLYLITLQRRDSMETCGGMEVRRRHS
jgi:hypothetical protein